MRKIAPVQSTRSNSSEPRRGHRSEEADEVRYPFPRPDVLTIDFLGIISDEELSSSYTRLNQQRNEILKSRLPTRLWDVELAYLQRETKIRAERRMKHREFLDALQAEINAFHAYENTLPEFVPNAAMEMN